MAFTGAATVKQVSDRLVRITGIALANGANGTIGLFGKTVAPDVRLPEGFKPKVYDPAGAESDVTLQDSIQCWFVYTNPPAANTAPIGIVKTGTTDEDFVITLTNTGAAASGNIEVYVAFH